VNPCVALPRLLGPILCLAAFAPMSHASPDPIPDALQPLDLPDPLRTLAGEPVTSAEQWLSVRRAEILELFRAHVHGRNPVGRPDSLTFTPVGEPAPALEGRALLSEAWIGFSGPGGDWRYKVTLYIPVAPERPRGVFVFININANTIISAAADPAEQSERWPVRDIIGRGYATLAFQHSHVAGALGREFDAWVHGVFDPPGQRAGDAWGVVAAWAWGASRAIDFLETQPRLRSVPVAVVGHSRGGKAALWAGATDPRVDLSISNNSGAGGAKIARMQGGESLYDLNRRFPAWFCDNFTRYNHNEDALPVDAHMLLALAAPRRVYVASATEDAWANPQAEFRACLEAAPVFALFGLDGPGAPTFPAPNEVRHDGAIGYHLREGKHLINQQDWSWFMDYTDRHW
jgi:hypothetical protein